MCRHSKKPIDELAKRQRGFDARGNDPLATQRESSWATAVATDSTKKVLDLRRQHLAELANAGCTGAELQVKRDKFKAALAALPPDCSGRELTELMLRDDAGFKGMMDGIGKNIKDRKADLYDIPRALPVFKERGREGMPRQRANSKTNLDAGITTTANRTADTRGVFAAPVYHAKADWRGQQSSSTFKDFKTAGAPFIGGASGTMHFVTMQMEDNKKRADLSADELDNREALLGVMSAQLVAGGHHSMAECLLSAKAYGYFAEVPDPLADYDLSMAALGKRLSELGVGGSGKPPLSREGETQGKSQQEVDYRDRRSAVATVQARHVDQFLPEVRNTIAQLMTQADAAIAGNKPDFTTAMAKLNRAEERILYETKIVAANARGQTRVLTGDDLVARMGKAPKSGKKDSVEYKQVQAALDQFSRLMKELSGRKLDHDMAASGFLELRAVLEAAERGAKAYNAKHAKQDGKQGRRDVMSELLVKIDAEKTLLDKTERDQTAWPKGGSTTIEQAIEFNRRGIDVARHAAPDRFDPNKIDWAKSDRDFGSGAVNKVAKLSYVRPDGTLDVQVFKPEQEQPKDSPIARQIGIDVNDARFGKRNVASGKAADRLGLGAMLPTPAFTTLDGKLGLNMPMAPGKSVMTKVWSTLPYAEDSYGDIKIAKAAKAAGKADWDKGLPENLRWDKASNSFQQYLPKVRRLPLAVPPPADPNGPPRAAKASDATPTQQANVQKSMMDLQWLDAFCGQMDRHQENFLMDFAADGSVKVTGIDNDFSFGKGHKDVNNAMACPNYCGLPNLIDEELYDTIVGLTWSTVKDDYAGLLSTEEIEAAEKRFNAIKAKVTQLGSSGGVVRDWLNDRPNGKTVTDILTDPASKNYYSKAVKVQASNEAIGNAID